MKTSATKSGFTLIELSIVLVIIGLIVGGVLVGRDLIKAAEIRATITQLERIKTAVNTFRTKYNALPGDMLSSTATALGFFAVTGSIANTAGYGDNNGTIEGGGGGTHAGYAIGEPLIFWRHLGEAGLISGTYGQTLNPATGGVTVTLNAQTMGGTLPVLKMTNGVFINELPQPIGPAFFIYAINYLDTIGGASGGWGYMTPLESFTVDNKTDDGLPNTGRMTALGCPTIGNAYDVGTVNGNSQACGWMIVYQ